jgi:hypothetical protein
MELIICGDFNINFSGGTTHKQLLNSLLATFGLYGTVNFPNRIYNNFMMTIDNVFINSVNQNSISVYPWINGLSDHDAQIIVLRDIAIRTYDKNLYFCRSFNRLSAVDLNLKLSYESWDNVFSYNDVNESFNNFLDTYLTLILLTWTKWRAPASASKWWMGFNSAFKGLKIFTPVFPIR